MFQGSLRDTFNFNMLFNMGGIRPSGFFSSMQLTIASTRYIQKINLIICQACGFLLVHIARHLPIPNKCRFFFSIVRRRNESKSII
jgi:hypothetical protein